MCWKAEGSLNQGRERSVDGRGVSVSFTISSSTCIGRFTAQDHRYEQRAKSSRAKRAETPSLVVSSISYVGNFPFTPTSPPPSRGRGNYQSSLRIPLPWWEGLGRGKQTGIVKQTRRHYTSSSLPGLAQCRPRSGHVFGPP